MRTPDPEVVMNQPEPLSEKDTEGFTDAPPEEHDEIAADEDARDAGAEEPGEPESVIAPPNNPAGAVIIHPVPESDDALDRGRD
jgi:hypothetical protein